MSVKALSAAFDDSRATGAAFIVLVAMADWADHNGRCYPSLSQIAKKARVSRASAAAAIGTLVQLGELEKVRSGHGPAPEDDEAPSNVRAQRRNDYRITLIRPRKEVVQHLDYLSAGPLVQPLDHPRPGQVVQPLDHHADRQVVQFAGAGSPISGPQVVQFGDAHIRNEPSVEPSDRPSATTAAAADEIAPTDWSWNPNDPCDAVALAWNVGCRASSLRPVQALTATRRRLIRARLVDLPLERLVSALDRIHASGFCAGANQTGFLATFDWVIGSADPLTRALEGQWDDAPFTDAELAAAKAWRFQTSGSARHCPHEPSCADLDTCTRRIALMLRQRGRSA